MARTQQTIDVNVPVSTAYNQWTQFEEFPEFMEGVNSVVQIDDRTLRWDAEIWGHQKTWEAEIREQVPDQRIIWHSLDGEENAGIVTFTPLDASSTRISLEMSYQPSGVVENVGDALGFLSRRVSGDLDRFKEFIEARNQATGAYRETLENPSVPGGFTRGQPAHPPASQS